MAMSTLECSEDDCGTEGYLEFRLINEKHGESIIGKNIRINKYDDWKPATKEDIKKILENKLKIQMRSPITCITPNFRMCKKCFGERQYPTKYLGISAGQNVTERFTQLTLRTFHTSGSATLHCDANDNQTKQEHKEIIKYFKDNIIDIDSQKFKTKIFVNNIDKMPECMKTLSGFREIDGNCIVFTKLDNPVKNKDMVASLNKIKDLLKSQKNNIGTPTSFYINMMTELLESGCPYSSFVEMIFANMFLTDIKIKEFWRYNQDKKIVCKLGDKILASMISPLLGLLFTPNAGTIEKVGKIDDLDFEEENLTIYEKIFLDIF
jgi:hypothetical protein